jgi:ABC-type nitrate/sulfonate/bicarbonate transport system permease component
VTFALLVCIPMLMIWFNGQHDIKTFTPAWAFLVFPMVSQAASLSHNVEHPVCRC